MSAAQSGDSFDDSYWREFDAGIKKSLFFTVMEIPLKRNCFFI